MCPDLVKTVKQSTYIIAIILKAGDKKGTNVYNNSKCLLPLEHFLRNIVNAYFPQYLPVKRNPLFLKSYLLSFKRITDGNIFPTKP